MKHVAYILMIAAGVMWCNFFAKAIAHPLVFQQSPVMSTEWRDCSVVAQGHKHNCYQGIK